MTYLISLTGWPGTPLKRGVPGWRIWLHCWTPQRAVWLLLPSGIATANWFSCLLFFSFFFLLHWMPLLTRHLYLAGLCDWHQEDTRGVLPWGSVTRLGIELRTGVWRSQCHVTRSTISNNNNNNNRTKKISCLTLWYQGSTSYMMQELSFIFYFFALVFAAFIRVNV